MTPLQQTPASQEFSEEVSLRLSLTPGPLGPDTNGEVAGPSSALVGLWFTFGSHHTPHWAWERDLSMKDPFRLDPLFVHRLSVTVTL